MPDNDITLGEITRRLDRMEKSTTEGFRAIEAKLERLPFVTLDKYTPEREALVSRLDTLEERAKWVSRTIAGAIVTMVASVILTLIAARGGF